MSFLLSLKTVLNRTGKAQSMWRANENEEEEDSGCDAF